MPHTIHHLKYNSLPSIPFQRRQRPSCPDCPSASPALHLHHSCVLQPPQNTAPVPGTHLVGTHPFPLVSLTSTNPRGLRHFCCPTPAGLLDPTKVQPLTVPHSACTLALIDPVIVICSFVLPH